MKIHQRPIRITRQRKGDWIQLHHGLFTHKSFGKSEHGPEYFIEQSAIKCCIDGCESPLTTMELGAGWGQQTLNMVGYCRQVKKYSVSYCVEADPTHYKRLLRVLRRNDIPAIPIYGAVSKELGWAGFQNKGELYAKHAWAQHLTRSNEEPTTQVPTFTLDWLFENFQIPKIHILHMDVQGAETAVITGGLKSLPLIDNIIIGIHAGDHINAIPELFKRHSPEHKVVLSLPKYSGLQHIEGFDEPVDIRFDGVLILSRV